MGVAHRDFQLENFVVIGKKLNRIVKLVDFSVCYIYPYYSGKKNQEWECYTPAGNKNVYLLQIQFVSKSICYDILAAYRITSDTSDTHSFVNGVFFNFFSFRVCTH